MTPLWFVHWLRALSVLIVVFVHVVVAFWSVNTQMAPFAHVDPLPLTGDPLLRYQGIQVVYGNMAVGFFFLISGFLIPLTLEGRSVGRFLTARIFRVYPVWIASLALTAVVFAIHSWGTGEPIGVPVHQWLANAGAVTDLVTEPVINPIIWTLLIEVKFYALCALAAATIGLQRPWAIALLAAGWAVFSVLGLGPGHLVWAAHIDWALWNALQAIAFDAKHMAVVLAGLCFYNLFRGHWSRGTFVLTLGICVAAIALCFWKTDDGFGYPVEKAVAYALALVLFGAAYVTRERFKPNRVIGAIADASFPLYALHYVMGIALMTLVWHATGSAVLATLAATAVIAVLTVVIHRYIEVPSIGFGKHGQLPGPFGRRPSELADEDAE